ncbi:MAG: porin [Alphaproteobacteria bacterium]|nr:porin [Alphaproteobacteria bacterium]
MKKALMGTTALVAAAVTTGVAAEEMMAEPISISVGGNSHWGIAIVDNEMNSDTSDDIALSNDVELRFAGSTVLDSGVEVGVRIEIEGEESTDQGDETYMYLEGSFGTIRVGNDDTASYQMSTAAPYATYFYGINTPFWVGSFSGPNSNWHSTFAGVNAGDSASVMYFSPVINGFQFGVSYAPEAGAEARSDTASRAKGGDVVSIGARFDGAFGDAGVTVAAGYASQEKEPMSAVTGSYIQADGTVGSTKTDDVLRKAVTAAPGATETDYNAGVVVSMSGVSVGGSYRATDHDDGSDDTEQFDVGISYGEGPWTISLNYGEKTQDSAGTDNTYARLLGNYNLGPGINLAGALGQDTLASDENTTFAGVAMAISF